MPRGINSPILTLYKNVAKAPKENTPVKTIIIPSESSLKRARPLPDPEDFDPISPEDSEFPVPAPGEERAPAVKLSTYRLPLNVFSESQQAQQLGWDKKTVKLVNLQTNMYSQIPKICAGTMGCPFGPICEIENRDDFIGRSCPLEVKVLFTNFAGYIRDLEIEPENFIDLKLVADLCRQEVILWRTDMKMRLEGETPDEVAVVAQKTGDVYYRPSVNKNRDIQREARTAIHNIYQKLIATRSEKRNSNKDDKKVDQIALILSGLDTPKQGE